MWKLGSTRRVVYRLPEVLEAVAAGDTVYIVEGEKDADRLRAEGVVATCNPHGAGKWHARYNDTFKGAHVVVIADLDDPGRAHAADIAHHLDGVATTVEIRMPYEGKDVSDHFQLGHTLDQFLPIDHDDKQAGVTPIEVDGTDFFTDAHLADRFINETGDGRLCWTAGLGWMRWNSTRWVANPEEVVIEDARRWALDHFQAAVQRLAPGADTWEVDAWKTVLSRGRTSSIVALARGIALRDAADFDQHPDLLNTPAGVVDLRTGTVTAHDPDLLLAKITSGNYRPGFTHPDWDKALQALPNETRGWFQARSGQAITGHTTPDGVLVVLQGSGENGKGAVGSDGLLPAFGDYAAPASAKLLGAKDEHSTERAELRGQRLIISEEMTEGRSLNVTAIKQIQDVAYITARHVYQKNMKFKTSHSLFATTNYIPVVNETDHGTWRRLALLVFPYTFRKPSDELRTPLCRRGDPGLKERIRTTVTTSTTPSSHGQPKGPSAGTTTAPTPSPYPPVSPKTRSSGEPKPTGSSPTGATTSCPNAAWRSSPPKCSTTSTTGSSPTGTTGGPKSCSVPGSNSTTKPTTTAWKRPAPGR